MSNTKYYLACDLGAESGRVMLGSLADNRLQLEELHRFPNTPLKSSGSLHWDIPRLFGELKIGLRKAASRGLPISSISTDSWGVDYLLFDSSGQLMSPAFHYRDPRTEQGVKRAFSCLDWPSIFTETGIQFMVLNTLYQLAAENSARLSEAKYLLGIGDGFNHMLGGQPVIELSMASTFQLYNPVKKGWSEKVIHALKFPPKLFPQIVPSGTSIGKLRPEIAEEVGLSQVEIVASCSHDTGAAVAAVPASGGNWAYLSSGTWSLMGVELETPIVTDACREANFTNEIGYNGSIRLLKNIIGLWLIQECRRNWVNQGTEYDYATLARLASDAAPFVSLINPADQRFLSPPNMLEAIASFCRETNQPVPATPGATARCIMESLALLYRYNLLQIEQLTGRRIERLHVVGGGSKNQLLNQFTANALKIPVVAGPAEATAAGNILIQALTLRHLPSWSAARAVVRDSLEMHTIQPQSSTAWEEAFLRFKKWL